MVLSEYKNVSKVFIVFSVITAVILNVLWATGIVMYGTPIEPVDTLELLVPIIFSTNYGPLMISIIVGALASMVYKAYIYYKR